METGQLSQFPPCVTSRITVMVLFTLTTLTYHSSMSFVSQGSPATGLPSVPQPVVTKPFSYGHQVSLCNVKDQIGYPQVSEEQYSVSKRLSSAHVYCVGRGESPVAFDIMLYFVRHQKGVN